MLRWLLILLLLSCTAGCVSRTAPQQLPGDCRAEFSRQQLLAQSWLLHPAVWRLRQSALLELGPKKLPLEGFLRLDLQQRQARLVAMNELGLVLFDLQVDVQGEYLLKAVPQLARVERFAAGVGQSVRQIFLQPRPQIADRLLTEGHRQRLQRALPGGQLDFVFDCLGELRETRQQAADSDWRVYYDQYRELGGMRLPERIILDDFRQRLKLTLWLREGKQEP